MSFFLKRGVPRLPCGKPFRPLAQMFRKSALLVRVGVTTTLAIACAFYLPLSLTGCGMAASPQPPSLQLPRQISDLTASRTGDQVSLQWSTPKENTDHLKLVGMVRLRICRQQQQANPCQTIATVSADPGKPAQYMDVLPAAFAAGPLRPLRYSIFGINKHGRTAGASNTAMVLAGTAPPTVQNLSLQVVERGVVLRWQSVPGLPSGTSIEIERTLATPATPAKPVQAKTPSLLPHAVEPVQQKLRVDLAPASSQTSGQAEKIDPGIALDSSAQFGKQYSYTVSRVVDQPMENRTLQVASSPSASVNIVTRDTFPPSLPVGLAAVPVSASMNNGMPEIDLSWSANTEPDLAQYRVYRQDVTQNESMQQIAPANDAGPIVAPAFRDLHVQPGHTYAYAVTAVDAAGNESPQSPKIQVTVPAS